MKCHDGFPLSLEYNGRLNAFAFKTVYFLVSEKGQLQSVSNRTLQIA